MAPSDRPPGPDGPEPPRPRSRTLVLSALGAVLAVLIVAIVGRVGTGPGGGGGTGPGGGGGGGGGGGQAAVFDVGPAAARAPSIARSGPLLFPDPQGGTRDIFVQHVGEDVWTAFEARAKGAPRRCALRWEHAPRHFVDPCDGRVYPPDGAGLVSFPAEVNEKGRVIVDLSRPAPP